MNLSVMCSDRRRRNDVIRDFLNDNPLPWANKASSDHHEVIAHFTIVGESTHWSDGLVSWVKFGGSIVLDNFAILSMNTSANAVDLLVDLSSVMVSLLTSSGNRVLNSARMPSSNTSNLAKTFVGFAGQFLTMPTGSNTFHSTTFGYTNDVNKLILVKDSGHSHGFLKVFFSPVNFVSNSASIQLDFHKMSLLLALAEQFGLGVSKDSHDLAVLLDLVEIRVNLLLASLTAHLVAYLVKAFFFELDQFL